MRLQVEAAGRVQGCPRRPEHRDAAAPGQHTDEVLVGLGYSQDDIAKLRAEGAI